MNSRQAGEKAWQVMRNLFQNIVSLFTMVAFPRRCPICDGLLEPEQDRSKIHPECEAKLYPVMGTVCMQCGRPLHNATGEYCYDCGRKSYRANVHVANIHVANVYAGNISIPITQGKALFLYQGVIKQTMYRFKYSNKREYGEYFAEQAVAKYGRWMRDKQIDVIVPVPMYRKKQRVRGYNQAETFATQLSQLTGIPMDRGLIERIVDTTPQKELNDLERKNNLKSAFQKCESIVQYSHILVVDDIYTTGSTAEAVAEELIKTNAKQIYFLSICIGKGM